MHIMIDGRHIRKRQAGLGSYSLQLIKALASVDRDNRYTVLCTRRSAELVGSLPSNFQLHTSWIGVENHVLGDPYRQLIVPILMLLRGVDIYHDPAYLLPYLHFRSRLIVTVHDLVPFYFPETNRWRYIQYMRLNTRASVRIADAVIVDSDAVRIDLIDKLGVPYKKIRCIPLGVSPDFHVIDDDDSLKETLTKLAVHSDYILTVSTIEPRKNILRLIEAYALAVDRFNIRNHLVICGRKGFKSEDIEKTIRKNNCEGKVHLTGYVEQSDLINLYNCAALYVCPSLYEGFGLPVLEAMACGVPVVVSNKSALPEIVGDAGLLFDPNNIENMITIMARPLLDKNIHDSMRKAGLIHSAQFTWQKTAKKTIELYNDVIAK